MKLLVISVSLFAMVFAIGPPTPTCIDRCASALEAAGQVNIPDIDRDVLLLLGLVKLRVSAVLDCTALAAYVRLATEKSYTEATSGSVVSFQLELEVALPVDLTLNAVVAVWTSLGIQLGVGTCVLGYVDVVITIDIEGRYLVGENPADSVIMSVNASGTRATASDWLAYTGISMVDNTLAAVRADILNEGFLNAMVTINSLLNAIIT